MRTNSQKCSAATQQKVRQLGFDQLETHYQKPLVLEKRLRCVD